MTGPKYRKIAMNGRPLSDEKPQHTAETDQVKEESYIDALTLGLRHNTTDVYIPLVGDQLALTVRRNLGTEILNSKSGIALSDRVDLPFGVCWSSNVLPHIDLVHQAPTPASGGCLSLEPDYVNVTDETGSSFRFLVALVSGVVEFLACPSNQLDVDCYQATLVVDARGENFLFTKKFGTSIQFTGPVATITIPSDSTDPDYGYTETHTYYKATRVQDRFGLGLNYTYGVEESPLIPTQIQADTGQTLVFDVSEGRIIKVTDPAGNRTTYAYSEDNMELLQVSRPLDTVIVYTYVEHFDEDPMPPPPPSPFTIFTHVDLASISTDGATFAFAYQFDVSKQVYSSELSSYYTKAGEPMWVSKVTQPDGSTVTLSMNSLMTLIGGGLEFEGYRNTSVTDAMGYVRNYSFGGIIVTFLNNLDAELDIASHGNPLRPPKLVIFETMTVQHVGFGTETFSFAEGAGMALSSITDLCGNTTTFEYNDPMPMPGWAVGFPVLYYNDPNVENRPLGATKHFSYGVYRVMSQVIDENGQVTVYALDGLGRRLTEAVNTDFQVTSFEYGSVFRAFLTQKTIARLYGDGAPADASPAIVTRYVNDGFGRVYQEIRETGTEDLTTTHTYDANNNKTGTTDPRGNTTSFTYDAQNRLTEITYPPTGDPLAESHKYLGYDRRGNKIQEIDERAFLTNYTYDLLNRVIVTRRVMNGFVPDDVYDLITVYTYNAVGSRLSVKDPNGYFTTMEYDGLQRLISTTRPITGDVTTYGYDLTKNAGSSAFDTSRFKPTTSTDPEGYVTQVDYDALYRPVKKWAEYGEGFFAFSQMSYDPVGNLLLEQHSLDPVGFEAVPVPDPTRTEFVLKVYDPLNRPVEVITSLQATGPGLPPSTVTTYMGYTSTALKWQVTDELGRQFQTYYDGAGRAIKTISPLVDNGSGTMTNAIIQTAYDGNNNVVQTINPLNRVWQFQYDARNRKTVELQPGPTGLPPGPTIYHGYDAVGNAVSLKDPNGNVTTTTYDQNNRPTLIVPPEVTRPDGVLAHPVMTNAYDKNGNVIGVVDPNGHATVNAYDAINRLISTTDAAGITVSFGYDLVDNRTSVTDGLSQTTHFGYDGLKRNTATTDPAGKTTALGYDAINKISRTDPLGQVTFYSCDLRNHLLTTTYAGRSDDDRSYVYDLVGNLLSVTEAGHSGAADAAYTYDALNRQITENTGGYTHEYKYDLANNRIHVQYGGTGRVLVSTYDQLNRLSTLTEDGRMTTYGYDANGNVISKELPNGETITTTVDAINRRTEISAPAYTYTQLYDLVGNLVQIQETYPDNASLNRAVSNIYDQINRLTKETFSTLPLVLDGGTGVPPYYPASSTITSVTTYAYDAAHNRTQRVKAGVTTTYTYGNTLNQLSQWSDGTNTVTYTYDFNGNRKTRTQGGTTDTNGYDYDNRLVSTSKAGVPYSYLYDYRTRRVNRVEGGFSTQILFSGGTSIAEFSAPGSSESSSSLSSVPSSESPSSAFSSSLFSSESSLSPSSESNSSSSSAPPSSEPSSSEPSSSSPSTQPPPGPSSEESSSLSSGFFFESFEMHRAASGGAGATTPRVVSLDDGSSTLSSELSSASSEPSSETFSLPSSTPSSSLSSESSSSDPTLRVEYIRGSEWGGGVGGLLYSIRSGTPSFTHCNSRGDVTTKTNGTGAVTWQAEYEAFGTRPKEVGSTLDRQKANTKEEDPTGLLNEGFRYRDLETGEFIIRDPAGFVDGPNLYAYVRQNPWSKFDPRGLRDESKEEVALMEHMHATARNIRSATQARLDKFNATENPSPGERLGVPMEVNRSFSTANAIDSASARIQKEIANVKPGQRDPANLSLKLNALKMWNDPVGNAKFDMNVAMHATCNAFVREAFGNSNMLTPMRLGISGLAPMGAGEWHADTAHEVRDRAAVRIGYLRSIYEHSDRSEVAAESLPKSAGVISYSHHVAVYIGDGLTVGSTQTHPIGAATGPISLITTSNSQPFRILELQLHRQPR